MSRAWSWVRGLQVAHLWTMLIVMAVTGPASFVGCWWWLHQPPIVVFDSFEADAVATSGGSLDLIVTKIDNAPCLTEAARWLWRYDPQDPLPDTDPRKRKQWREITGTPHAPPAVGRVTTYRLVVPLPPGIEPGDWHYQGQAVDRCTSALTSGPRFGRDIPVRIDPAREY